MPFSAAERASRHDRLIATVLLGALVLSVAACIPVRSVHLGDRPAFLVFYGVVLGTSEGLTAFVLYWRARVTNSARLARLAAAYAYSTPLIIANVVLLPGVGDLPVPAQSAPWLWVLWHIGWSTAIAVFAFSPDRATRHPARPLSIGFGVGLAVVAIAIGTPVLPALLKADGSFAPLLSGLYVVCALPGLAAIALLASRWQRLSEFELWILAAVTAIMLDVAITMLGSARFSVGFYVGRSLGMISGAFVLYALARGFVRLVGRADLTDAERRANRQLDFFSALGDSLGRTLDRDTALRTLSERLVPRLADWTLVNLAGENGTLVLAAAYHGDVALARRLDAFVGTSYDLPQAHSVSARVFATRAPLVGEYTTPARVRNGVIPAFADVIDIVGMHSYIAVPIVANGVVYGTFHALSSESATVYTERDIPFFVEVGRRVGYALQNADRYERESRIAHAFQSAALPATLPQVPGLTFSFLYEPASREANVGGDFYDAFRLADGRIVISIGDVAGAGIAAAATMAAVRQSIRAVAGVDPNPDALLRAAEGAFTDPEGPLFATAFVAVIDPITLSLRYASAGHPPPLLRAPDGSVTPLDASDLVLGINLDRQAATRSIRSTRIVPGSMLALYTDGLSEAERDPIGGEARLAEALARIDNSPSGAAGAARAIRDAVLGIEAASHDDMALLTVFFEASLGKASPHVSDWLFDCTDGAAARNVRVAVMAALRSSGLTDDDVFNAEMIFSELVGNALRYAAAEVDVMLDLTQDAAVLHVLDRGAGFYLNSKLPADAFAERGRGLYIVSQLAAEFTVSPRTARDGSHARVVLRGRIHRRLPALVRPARSAT